MSSRICGLAGWLLEFLGLAGAQRQQLIHVSAGPIFFAYRDVRGRYEILRTGVSRGLSGRRSNPASPGETSRSHAQPPAAYLSNCERNPDANTHNGEDPDQGHEPEHFRRSSQLRFCIGTLPHHNTWHHTLSMRKD